MPDAGKAFEFEVERDGARAVVHCRGRLVIGTTEELYQGVKPLLTEVKTLVMDLEGVTYMDSMGLGAMVRMYVSARGAGVTLQVTHVARQVRNLFKLTNLLGVLGDAEESGTAVH